MKKFLMLLLPLVLAACGGDDPPPLAENPDPSAECPLRLPEETDECNACLQGACCEEESNYYKAKTEYEDPNHKPSDSEELRVAMSKFAFCSGTNCKGECGFETKMQEDVVTLAANTCSSAFDGFCDDWCAEGSDTADCTCDTQNDGVCDAGSTCPYGSDDADCLDACPFTEDNFCDEGVTCPDGTDTFDCFCPYENDGVCDAGVRCAQNTDVADCSVVAPACATTNDGYCDEGVTCPANTDLYDCFCLYENDGYCDAGKNCPWNTDRIDCLNFP